MRWKTRMERNNLGRSPANEGVVSGLKFVKHEGAEEGPGE